MIQYSVIMFLLLTLTTPPPSLAADKESICYGTTSNGLLEGGVALPASGKNFQSYSSLGNLLGRTYIHSRVRQVVINAFKNLEESHPDKVFMYGETGWEEGGRFKPHKTHQNGLSVDFMVPVVDRKGRSVYLPTGPTNKFGYAIEFDKQGKFKEYTIDFEAMAAHLVSLHKEALAVGIDIWRVIFAPELQPYLFRTSQGAYLREHLQFSKKPAWVRHDEHYHVDFKVKCRPL
jgi:penicillin-insensitive murein endopeptidase